MRKLTLTLLALCLPFGTCLANTVGSGGDELRELFGQARAAAIYDLSHVQWCSFNSSADPKLNEWILEHSGQLAADIQSSDQRWVVDNQPTCAFTEHAPGAPIYLSYPTCASTVGTSLHSATFILLHEAAHHLGIRDEKQADTVASLVLGADLTRECPAQSTDFFRPEICQGPNFSSTDAVHYLPAGVTSAEFGNYSAYGRTRSCTKLAGCGQWQGVPQLQITNGSVFYSLNKPNLKFEIYSASQAPYYSLYFNSDKNSLLLPGNQGGLSPGQYYLTANTISPGGGGQPSFQIRLKSHCLWVNTYVKSGESSGQWNEAETVIYGTH